MRATSGVTIVRDVESTLPDVQRQLRDFIADSSALYLTFCLDVLPASAAPGVSAPAGLGVPLHRAVEREVGIPVKLVGVGERVEDLLPFDPEAFVDALLGGS